MDVRLGMRIGELAERAGCATSAVRYYERIGLLDQPERINGQRRYPEQAAGRLELILVLREAGLGVREVAVALDRSAERSGARRNAARERARDLRAHIRTVTRALALLDHAGDCTVIGDDDDAACAADVRRRLAAAGL